MSTANIMWKSDECLMRVIEHFKIDNRKTLAKTVSSFKP
jgi:hypothetical protein